MELETAMRLNLPVVNIVSNNETLGMERRGFLRFCGKALDEAVNFSPQDFAGIAEAFGCFGVRVERPKDIRDAISAAIASKKPSIVDVITESSEYDSEEIPW